MPKLALNDQQSEAFKIFKKFLDHPVADTYVLQGYAGTGKTFLMQHIALWLQEKGQSFSMLASTGRAATILRGKTGLLTRTVHSELYHFHKVEGDDEDITEDAPIDRYGQMTLQFLLRMPDDDKRIYIIDESSMLSSEMSGSDSVSFGSGALLVDFFEAVGKNKVVFVGDPCQLPPVGQTFSPALDKAWLEGIGRTPIFISLNKIERTDPNNDILVLASAIRDLSLKETWPKYPKLPAKNLHSVKLYNSQKELFDAYVKRYKETGTNSVLAISRSNKMVQNINRAFRRDMYNGLDKPLQNGDVLLVVQNNHAVPLTNGDFVLVLALGETRLQSNLHFQSVRVKALTSEEEYELLVSLDILYGNLGKFSKEQEKALMVDFSRRMKRKKIKPNTDPYKEAMLKDSYINCLRATYGYAVTCHKAQGGEWDEVFLFLEKSMYSMKPLELCRWWYTAVTRVKKELHLLNEWWIC